VKKRKKVRRQEMGLKWLLKGSDFRGSNIFIQKPLLGIKSSQMSLVSID